MGTQSSNNRHYTPKEKAEALSLLSSNGGNCAETARQLGISRLSLQLWRDQAELRQSRAGGHKTPRLSRAVLAGATRALAEDVLAYLLTCYQELSPRDAATVYGILIDKHAALGGGDDESAATVAARDDLTTILSRLSPEQRDEWEAANHRLDELACPVPAPTTANDVPIDENQPQT